MFLGFTSGQKQNYWKKGIQFKKHVYFNMRVSLDIIK